jgi:hypothetical protein
MHIFVWRGPLVLKNYASGIAVVAAPSLGEAWAKLRAEAPAVWMRLTHGNHHGWADTEDEIAWHMSQEDFETEEGFPLQPEVFTVENLPVLYRNGGE